MHDFNVKEWLPYWLSRAMGFCWLTKPAGNPWPETTQKPPAC